MNTYHCHRFPPDTISNPRPVPAVILAGLYRNPLEIHGQIYCRIECEKGAYPGVEIPNTPDEPDEVDDVDAVEGISLKDRSAIDFFKGSPYR